MEVNGTIALAINMTGTKTLDLSTVTDAFSNPSQSTTITDGAGASKAEVQFHDQISIADAGSAVIVLDSALSIAGTPVFDAFGDTHDLSKVKALLIQNLSADATLLVGNTAANPFWLTSTNVIPIPPGGRMFIECHTAAGIPVDATHSDLLLTHDGTGASAMLVNIWILAEET